MSQSFSMLFIAELVEASRFRVIITLSSTKCQRHLPRTTCGFGGSCGEESLPSSKLGMGKLYHNSCIIEQYRALLFNVPIKVKAAHVFLVKT